MSDGAAAKALIAPEEARDAMLVVRDTGRSALADMRRMLGVLRTGEPGSQTPQPGLLQLEKLIEDNRIAGLPVTLIKSGVPEALPTSLEATIYRVIQESLTNVRKHAGTTVTNAQVSLEYGTETITVKITDDGQGPSNSTRAGGSNLGLLGMHERVSAHAGSLHTGPNSHGGFQVSAQFPLSLTFESEEP